MPEYQDLTSAERTVISLSRVSDMRQRSFALADRLKNVEIQLAVDVMKLIWEKALMGHEDFLRLYNGLLITGTLEDVLGSRKMSELVEEAQTRNEYGVAAILMDMPNDAYEDSPFQPFLDGSLKETPLGMRKALARSPDFKLIQRIARDQDHRVIRNLLDNPRLTEKDVIHIGSTRPTSPRVLEVIYDHPKWITRYSVKKVIVLSPYAPPFMSIRLLTFMTQEDLLEVAGAHDLRIVLREQATRIIEEKNRLNSAAPF